MVNSTDTFSIITQRTTIIDFPPHILPPPDPSHETLQPDLPTVHNSETVTELWPAPTDIPLPLHNLINIPIVQSPASAPLTAHSGSLPLTALVLSQSWLSRKRDKWLRRKGKQNSAPANDMDYLTPLIQSRQKKH